MRYLFGRKLYVDEQHKAPCCASCHLMLDVNDVLFPTIYDDFRCIDCVDRSSSNGRPIAVVDLVGMLSRGDAGD